MTLLQLVQKTILSVHQEYVVDQARAFLMPQPDRFDHGFGSGNVVGITILRLSSP